MGKELVPGRLYLAVLANCGVSEFNRLIGYLKAKKDDKTIDDFVYADVGLTGPLFSMYFDEDENLREFLEEDRKERGIDLEEYYRCPIRIQTQSREITEFVLEQLKDNFPRMKSSEVYFSR